jgi:hypothetical protein
LQIVVIDPPKKHPKLSFGAQPFHVNPKHHGEKTGIVSRLQERGAEQKWRRKEVGCAPPTPGPRERSTFHIKEHRRKTPRPGPPAPASFPKEGEARRPWGKGGPKATLPTPKTHCAKGVSDSLFFACWGSPERVARRSRHPLPARAPAAKM